MSNIIKKHDDLLMIVDDIKYIENHDITKSFVEELLKQMIPSNKGKPLIKYIVIKNKTSNDMVAFNPKTKTIEVNLNKLNQWVNACTNQLISDYNLSYSDTKLLQSYSLVHIIAHEIEHSYQYLIAQKKVDIPNEIISNAYKGLFDLITKSKDYVKRGMYTFYHDELLIERNAQIESFDLILKCAKNEDRQDLYNAYSKIIYEWIKLGYRNSNEGSISQTYRVLDMYDKYLNFYHELPISESEKIRYGFPISSDTYQKKIKPIL